jgi:cell filamentation protein
MSKGSRYDTSGLVEDMYEPGSRRRVLKNKLGITRKRVMDEVEAREQLRALHEFLGMYDREYRFSAADICHMHKVWLGDVYGWAGQYRQVNISKDNFTFAMALQVPKLMKQFEHGRYFQGCFGKVSSEGSERLMRSIRSCSASIALLADFPMPSTALDDKTV